MSVDPTSKNTVLITSHSSTAARSFTHKEKAALKSGFAFDGVGGGI